ncbi:6-phosphofructokinase [Lampropedia cohaerens]|uniref:6-phosphofructokinase n=1 Tax=Lampropedia cohaerens TaxID=1610491 RepID=A0A0U1PX43_9BURK|nr:6-phosphofructokinase [Lampropedia cohaerens]
MTGGGDCPGLNAVIRAVTQSLILQAGVRVTGIEQGFLGLIEGRFRPLELADVTHILGDGGTVLGAHNAANPFDWHGEDVSAQALANARALGLDALVVVGGDGTMRIAHRFDQLGLPVVGVPKTIDNDLLHTDRTFGFDSAVAVVSEALQRLQTTARSHQRVMILETMGRYAGWIALHGGLAAGADILLIPEVPFSPHIVAEACTHCVARQGYALICIAEGAHAATGKQIVRAHLPHSPDPLRLGGVGEWLCQQLEGTLTSEVRSTQLGHIQRGGPPTPFDAVLATLFGWHAAQLVLQGQFGRMVVLRGQACASVPLVDVAQGIRTVGLNDPALLAARDLGICLGN